MSTRIEVYGLTPEDIRAEIQRAVETALDKRLQDLQALQEVIFAAQGILTAHAVGRLMGVSARTVLESYVPSGLKVYRVGKAPLFLTEDVVAFIKQHPDTQTGSASSDE